MDVPVSKRRRSVAWEHFQLETPNKVRCRICAKQLAYRNNTSTMIRHLTRVHKMEDEENAAAPSFAGATSVGTSGQEYEMIHEALFLLQPFKAATTELSEEKRVSASKVIPLYRMLQHNLFEKLRHSKQPATQQLGTFLKDGPQARCGQYETVRPLALATLLDPRFKNLGFGNPAKAQEAEKQLILECATLIQPAETSDPQIAPSSSSTAVFGTCLTKK
ncbi:uncharacterized protein LOC115438939 [Sphaeramia orbicularis]|uniref:uncharacterized protein LOC115438939 n=1 Tax=Sphaeramia orbicularis TaxID=375764 RepID=UPI00117FD452|nr:uncharacterized protein LOC115438939 [Sphaeramia orbicularis]